jgi:hypothetical protein
VVTKKQVLGLDIGRHTAKAVVVVAKADRIEVVRAETLRLPDGSILTAFGTGYRCQDIVKGQPAPRDVGLVRCRLNTETVNSEAKLRSAGIAS